jgi:hypothetical protein
MGRVDFIPLPLIKHVGKQDSSAEARASAELSCFPTCFTFVVVLSWGVYV